MLQREGEGNGDGFLIFVWRQWLCDGDNGRYLDCFVNLMGPKIWIGSGLFLDLYVPLPRLQLQIFFYFGESYKYYIWEWDTSFFLPFFDNCDFLVFVMRTLQFWLGQIALHGFTRFSFIFFSFLCFFFFNFLSKASHLQYTQSISILIKIKISL